MEIVYYDRMVPVLPPDTEEDGGAGDVTPFLFATGTVVAAAGAAVDCSLAAGGADTTEDARDEE